MTTVSNKVVPTDISSQNNEKPTIDVTKVHDTPSEQKVDDKLDVTEPVKALPSKEGSIYRKGGFPFYMWHKRHLTLSSTHKPITLHDLRVAYAKNVVQAQAGKDEFIKANQNLLDTFATASVNNSNILFYSTIEDKNTPRSLINLKYVSSVETEPSRPTIFSIKTLGTEYTFNTDTKEDSEAWVQVIKQRLSEKIPDYSNDEIYKSVYNQLAERKSLDSIVIPKSESNRSEPSAENQISGNSDLLTSNPSSPTAKSFSNEVLETLDSKLDEIENETKAEPVNQVVSTENDQENDVKVEAEKASEPEIVESKQVSNDNALESTQEATTPESAPITSTLESESKPEVVNEVIENKDQTIEEIPVEVVTKDNEVEVEPSQILEPAQELLSEDVGSPSVQPEALPVDDSIEKDQSAEPVVESGHLSQEITESAPVEIVEDSLPSETLDTSNVHESPLSKSLEIEVSEQPEVSVEEVKNLSEPSQVIEQPQVSEDVQPEVVEVKEVVQEISPVEPSNVESVVVEASNAEPVVVVEPVKEEVKSEDQPITQDVKAEQTNDIKPEESNPVAKPLPVVENGKDSVSSNKSKKKKKKKGKK